MNVGRKKIKESNYNKTGGLTIIQSLSLSQSLIGQMNRKRTLLLTSSIVLVCVCVGVVGVVNS